MEAEKSDGEADDKREEKSEAKPVEIEHENYHYSDGSEDLYVDIAEGKVSSVELRPVYNVAQETIVFAGVFQFFYLRLAIFFGCLGVFMNLFRGEILDKSLHFYFLAPIRREVLMVGKFLAGLLATCLIFVTSELLQIVAFTWNFSPNVRDFIFIRTMGWPIRRPIWALRLWPAWVTERSFWRRECCFEIRFCRRRRSWRGKP